jgi:hypothetical protein
MFECRLLPSIKGCKDIVAGQNVLLREVEQVGLDKRPENNRSV